MNETTELIKRSSRIEFQELPEDVVSMAKSLFLDYLGVAIRGSDTESAKSAQSLAGKFHSKDADMAIIGTGVTTDPLHAAVSCVPDIDHPNQDYEILVGSRFQAAITSIDCGGDAELIFDGYGMPDSSAQIVIQCGAQQRIVLVAPETGLAGIQ